MGTEELKEKVNYCLKCKLKPCSEKGCPLGNNIPEFIEAIKEEKIEKAYNILLDTTVLSGVCGRICPHKRQCEGSCIRGIKGQPVSIGELEAFVFDEVNKEKNRMENDCKKKENKGDKKVAVIGGGPAGLTASAFLAREGIEVTIYEKHDYLGGLLVHGIPDFRLPRKTIEDTIENILSLGIEVEYNKQLGKNLKLEDLVKQYDAVFLSVGANISSKMGIIGEELDGVYGGNELLEYNLHPNYEGKTVAVIGGGDVAMDCARTVKKLGAKEVKVIYRRSKEEMPAGEKEVEAAINEGVDFICQNNILKIIGDNKVEKIELIKTKLIKKEGESRLCPINIENSNYEMNIDYVIMAIGSKVEKTIKELGLDTNEYGNIKINEEYQTSNLKIYAGGDLAGVKSTVAWAAYSGREAAKNIINNIKNKK